MGGNSPDFGNGDARYLANGMPVPGSTYQSSAGGYPHSPLMSMPLSSNLASLNGGALLSPGGTNYAMQGYYPMMVSFS